jgi:4-hydroxybenzoyl-CoA thioesterase
MYTVSTGQPIHERDPERSGPEAPFTAKYPIRFLHTDMAGIVYYPRYFDMFQALVEDWFDHWIGISYARLISERKVAFPSVKVGCEFVRPTRIGDLLALTLHLEAFGRASISIAVTGEVEGQLCLKGAVTLVTLSLETFKSIPIPDDARARLDAYRRASVRQAPDASMRMG